MLLVVSVLAFLFSSFALWKSLKDYRINLLKISRLEQKLLEAEEALKRRGDLANEIAHEIKNPITAILCSAETLDLLIGKNIDPEHRKSLIYIKEYGDNLLKLVSDFLDLSMAESGHFRCSPREVAVQESVESITGLLEASAIKKRIQIHCFFESEEIKAYVDPKHFKQIVFNLVHNAIKFTPSEGSVTVAVRQDLPNSFIKIAVKDNGCGIPSDRIPELFNIYSRYDESETEKSGGLGLGLALCRALVDLSGGEIGVKSEEGVGTCFEFSVPAWVEEEKEQSVSDQTEIIVPLRFESRPLTGQNYLIVDGDEGARESIASLLEAWGGLVDRAEQAREAVKALSTKQYDAVIFDTSSDGLNSYELSQLFRGELKTNRTSIILATKNQLCPARAIESGASRYIEKPISGKELLTTLLPGHRQITH